MRTIKTKQEYNALSKRIEQLLAIVNNNTPTDNKDFIELDLLSDLVADYEEVNEPIKTPSLVDVINYECMNVDLTKNDCLNYWELAHQE